MVGAINYPFNNLGLNQVNIQNPGFNNPYGNIPFYTSPVINGVNGVNGINGVNGVNGVPINGNLGLNDNILIIQITTSIWILIY